MLATTENKKLEPNAQEQKLIEVIRELGFGHVLIAVKDGKPIRAEEIRKSIQL